MSLIGSLWRKITPTKALEETSGKLETAFFESVYRLFYIAGLSTADNGFLYLLYSSTLKLMTVLFVAGELWYMMSYSSLDVVVEQANTLLILLIGLFRYVNVRRHKATYIKLASAMESPYFDTTTKTRRALVEYWRLKNERYLKLLIGLGSCTLAAWYVYPLVDDVEYNLTVALRLPVEYRTPVRYPIAYTITLLIFNYTAYFIMGNDIIMQAHLIHLVCQFNVLADCFENILLETEAEFKGMSQDQLLRNNMFRHRFLERLGRLVEQHKLLLDNTLELRSTLSAPMLAQVIASGMQMCFAGYQVALTITVSLTKFFMSLLFLGYNMFQLFIFCGWCDEIKTQSENIRDALYCSGWESGVGAIPGVRARLLITALRASKPLVLTAGGLVELSLSSFTDLVKTSYSALTVLLRLRH